MNYQYNNNPAKLNKRVTFFSPPSDYSDWPVETSEWTKFNTYWAEFKTVNGTRMFKADATQWQGKGIIGMRYKSEIEPEMRLKIGSKYYEIESLVNDDERNQWLTIIVKEVL